MTATGNLQETTHGHLKARWGYVLVGGGAIMLCWSANTLEITALASRAFAFYYMVQCLVGITVSNSARQKIGMIIVAALLAFIAVFAVPAS
jgi:ascorbate-specific PTS system EIIC-type component UlaA